MCHKSDVNPCMKISMKVVTSQSILFSEGKLFVPRQMWWFNDISAGFPVFREYRRIDKPLCWHQTIASCSVESLRPINSERGGKKENYSLQPECHIPTSMSSHCLVIFHISLNGPTNTQHCQKLVRDRPLPKTLYKKGFISAKLCLYLIPGGSSWSAFQSLPQPQSWKSWKENARPGCWCEALKLILSNKSMEGARLVDHCDAWHDKVLALQCIVGLHC